MRGFTFQQLAAPDFADGFTITHRNCATDSDDTRTTLDFHTFEGIIIKVHGVGFSGNLALVIRIINDKVGIRTGLDGAFAREEAKDFRSLGAGSVNKLVQVDAASFDAVSVIKVYAIFERRNAIRDLGEVTFAHLLLRIEVERRVVGRQRGGETFLQSVP